MAQPPLANLSLLELLAQDSDFQVPDDDVAVRAALAEYHVPVSAAKTAKAKLERRQLLAGLSWLHLHHSDMASNIARLSGDHQRILASALSVDLAAHVGSPSWPALLSRRIIAHALPGATPTKRPASVVVPSGQIQKPGGAGPPPDPSAHDDDDVVALDGPSDGPAPRSRKRPARRRLDHRSSSEESSGDEDAHSRRGAAAAPLAPMPIAYLQSAANDALAAAWCLRP
jgi:hypothetical protein